ncbi:hypothetical protein ABLE92_07245 [Gordonia sp. VNQ95]|uniref:hypothetical protein n=1 Tax=Gordonia sp. VNQ95 TaxID=3156619 RepID=UPI0032B6286D
MTLIDDVDVDAVRERSSGNSRRRRSGADADRPTRSRAAQRAIDRRSKRRAADDADVARAARLRAAAGGVRNRRITLSQRLSRVPFVVPVLLLLALGLGTSLWLSTMAAQDSYEIGLARNENQALADHADALKRTFESGNSAPELSDKASALGLVPAQNPARMVLGPDGKVRIIGDPTPATGTRMGTINPDPRPNPTAQIDPNKVDDSVGLSGSAATTTTTSAPATPTASTPTTSAPATPTPAPNTTPVPSSTPSGSVESGQTPTTPAPNVLPTSAPASAAPSTGNPPGGNSGENR